MEKSTLVEILRACGKKELREIRQWLHSPAHNHRQDVQQLFDYVHKHLGDTGHWLEKEKVWSKLFPGEGFDDARIRQSMYFLLSSVEECLSYLEFSKNPVKPQLFLATVYRQRQLDKPFRLTLESAKKNLEGLSYRDSAYFLDKFSLEQEQYFYLANQSRTAELNLQEVSDELDLAYSTNKLRILCRMLAHRAVFQKAHYETGPLAGLLEHIEAKGWTEVPAVAVYYHIYMALTDKTNTEHFNKLKTLIFTKDHLFLVAELREIYLQTINYCIARLNAGEISYARDAFELFNRGFEGDIFIENGVLSRFTFGNAIAAALKIGEFEWINDFIEKFQQFLDEKHRKSTVHFHLSRTYFEKKDYPKAMKMLTQFEYDDMLLNIITKTMLLKIYYEQDEFDALESLLESMRNYLQRKEALDPNRKTGYKNLLAIVKKMLNLNYRSTAQVEKLKQQILTTNPLMERDWLLRQIQK